MRARNLLPLALLAIWLQGCAHEPPPKAVTAVPAKAANRTAEIQRQLAPICPSPLPAASLNRAADYLDAHPDAFPVIGDLDRLDREARLCRGLKP